MIKQKNIFKNIILIIIFTALFFHMQVFAAEPEFVPVNNVTGMPSICVERGAIILTGTVIPSNATNRSITWSVSNAGTTEAFITTSTTIGGINNILNTPKFGSVTVRATITNGKSTGDYTQDFTIMVNALIRHNVTFDSNGGSSISPDTVIDGDRLTSPPVPTQADYVFVDWYTKVGISNIRYDFGKPVTAPLTLTAMWSPAGGTPGVSADIIIPGRDISDCSLKPLFEINISQELIAIPPDFNITYYSIDGGKNWKFATLNKFPKLFASILNKLHPESYIDLWLTNVPVGKSLLDHLKPLTGDPATTPPDSSVEFVKFDRIYGRPKLTNISVNYSIYRNDEHWTLTKKGDPTPFTENIEIGTFTKKILNDPGYRIFRTSSGAFASVYMPMPDTKTLWYARIPPSKSASGLSCSDCAGSHSTYTAPSKLKKFSVASAGRATSGNPIKTKKDKNIIKIRKGYIIFVGNFTDYTPGSYPIPISSPPSNPLTSGDFYYITKSIDIPFDTYSRTVLIWKAADKRPASQKQILAVNP